MDHAGTLNHHKKIKPVFNSIQEGEGRGTEIILNKIIEEIPKIYGKRFILR